MGACLDCITSDSCFLFVLDCLGGGPYYVLCTRAVQEHTQVRYYCILALIMALVPRYVLHVCFIPIPSTFVFVIVCANRFVRRSLFRGLPHFAI